MSSRKILILLFGIMFFGLSYSFANTVISPVVQIISYSSIFGKFPYMLGRGSASIISKDGVILTNNHVVDDGQGGVNEVFVICVTTSKYSAPECNYTATLINRDPNRDIAILKIDSTDLYGKSVDHSIFPSIELDYNYVPEVQDDVIAIGYPRVGLETITQTKGIVGGVVSYNDFNYIKMDTIIAGGNSGGPLMKGDKQIGVNTYTYGGAMDASLSYSLLIKEAQDFIKSNINSTPPKSNIKELISYIQRLNIINNQTFKIDDDLFSFNFDKKYLIRTYIPGTIIQGEMRKRNDQNLEMFNIRNIETPLLKNQSELFYYAEKIGLYYSDSEKLVTKKIDGITFYEPVYKYDVNGGEANTYKRYFAKIGSKSIIIIEVGVPAGAETIDTQAAKELESFLSGLKIKKENISKIKFNFTYNDPSISVKASPNSSIDILYANISTYLGNLHESIDVSLRENQAYDGKYKTVNDIYSTETEAIDDSKKSLIVVNGHEGFIYCTDSDASWGGVKVENGAYVNISNCIVKIFYKKTEKTLDYIILVSLSVESEHLQKYMPVLISYIKSNITLPAVGSQETLIPNIFKTQANIKINLADQSDGFKKTVELLTKYGIIPNDTSFDLSKPMKWKEFAILYMKSAYGFKYDSICSDTKDYECILDKYTFKAGSSIKNLRQFLSEMNVNLDSYVNQSLLEDFQTYIQIKIAGVSLPTYTQKSLAMFRTNPYDKQYKDLWKKIDEYEYSLFGDQKITIDQVLSSYSNYTIDKDYRFSDKRGLSEYTTYSDQTLRFDDTYNSSTYYDYYSKDFSKCLNKKSRNNCVTDYVSTSILQNEYEVLTRGEAIDTIMYVIDFGLFDQELAKRKGTQIDPD